MTLEEHIPPVVQIDNFRVFSGSIPECVPPCKITKHHQNSIGSGACIFSYFCWTSVCERRFQEWSEEWMKCGEAGRHAEESGGRAAKKIHFSSLFPVRPACIFFISVGRNAGLWVRFPTPLRRSAECLPIQPKTNGISQEVWKIFSFF